MFEQRFIELIQNNDEMMEYLKLVRELQLPQSYIAAGYVRNYIWDTIHGYEKRTPLNDIDVIYYHPDELDESVEKEYEKLLIEKTGNPLWSVKNQARMHIVNGNHPYTSVEDAIRYWPETVTAIAVRLELDDRISYLSPYGLEDIFECKVKRAPLFDDEAYFQARVLKKDWKKLWPKVQLEGAHNS